MDFRATTEKFLRTLAGGDAEEIAALFAERVDWKIYGSPDVPWIRHCRTREDVADFFRTMLGSFAPEGRSAEIDHILVDGPHAVVLGEISQVIKANGRAFSTPFALHLTGGERPDHPLPHLRRQPHRRASRGVDGRACAAVLEHCCALTSVRGGRACGSRLRGGRSAVRPPPRR
ncbi:nuclear transport factor 2 family protein [Saccharopolyspora sp. NPDC002686]|uniref:nuclear transport factor 2 family protein n=1 Tax=Saccharopolyspora sp. NPDC002686 TaxID=3154541 RepID=UPI00331C11EB